MILLMEIGIGAYRWLRIGLLLRFIRISQMIEALVDHRHNEPTASMILDAVI